MKNWEAIASHMNDDIREEVHAELAPTTEVIFLSRYLELDPDFAEILRNEFNITDIDNFEEYTIFQVGGEHDGDELETFRNWGDAFSFVLDFEKEHEDDDITVGIIDVNGYEVENW